MSIENMSLISNPQNPNFNPVIGASVASLANEINYAYTKISGTEAVTGFRFPRGFRGMFVIIPTGAFTGVTGGTLAYDGDLTADPVEPLTEDIPIGKAFTMIANVAAIFVTNGALVYPVAMVAELID